jgi:hypothetical protein
MHVRLFVMFRQHALFVWQQRTRRKGNEWLRSCLRLTHVADASLAVPCCPRIAPWRPTPTHLTWSQSGPHAPPCEGSAAHPPAGQGSTRG